MEGRVDLETLYYESVADGVWAITLNRPERSNAVVPELARDLLDVLGRAEADQGVRVLILTGAGKNFCAGADLHGFQKHLAGQSKDGDGEPYNARVLLPVTLRFASCRLPMIAAINGAATAGGLDMALACDIRIASTAARLGETYIKVGLSPGNGGAYFLPRLVGSGMAAELAFTGDIVDAQRALEIGLVNRVTDPEQLLRVAIELAAKIASYSRLALEATKQQLRQSWHLDLAGAMNAGFWAVSALGQTDDLKEGVAAALEKRPPKFNQQDSKKPR